MRTSVAFLVISLTLAAACSQGSGTLAGADEHRSPSIVAGSVNASVANGKLILKNDTEQVVEYVAHESVYHDQSLALWCFGAAGCGTKLVQGESASIPLTSIPGYRPGAKEISVFWWRPGGAVERIRVALP